jgi:hypothetical protein
MVAIKGERMKSVLAGFALGLRRTFYENQFEKVTFLTDDLKGHKTFPALFCCFI